MAPERDELERRRRKRAALRKKQLMEQRRMRMRLMIAGVVMILVIALIFFVVRDIAQNHPEGESTPSQELVTEPPTQERATQPPDTPTTTIHIRAAGDLNVTDKVVAAGKTNYGDGVDDLEAGRPYQAVIHRQPHAGGCRTGGVDSDSPLFIQLT